MNAESQDNEEQRVVEKAIRDAYRLLDDGIESIGGIAVGAGVCAFDRSDLRKSLDHAGGRRGVALDDALRIGARITRFNRGLVTKLGSALVTPFDLGVFPLVALTDKERADKLEALVRSMPLGEQLVDEALGTRR